MSLLHINEKNFKKEVLESPVPVLVDFWAAWCGPCKLIAPIIEELGREYSGKMKIGKIDVEESPAVAGQFGIMSIPTLMFFSGGKVVEQVVGALSKPELKRRIEEILAK